MTSAGQALLLLMTMSGTTHVICGLPVGLCPAAALPLLHINVPLLVCLHHAGQLQSMGRGAATHAYMNPLNGHIPLPLTECKIRCT
jgi:hypothetical protein